jgi:hypothetical protein
MTEQCCFAGWIFVMHEKQSDTDARVLHATIERIQRQERQRHLRDPYCDDEPVGLHMFFVAWRLGSVLCAILVLILIALLFVGARQ